MYVRKSIAAATAALVTLIAVPALAGAETAPAARAPRIAVNGHDLVPPTGSGVHIHNDRMYLPLDSFAEAIGATVKKDEAGVYWVSTGKGIPTVTELAKINPKLAAYQPLSPYIPAMGIHQGAHGPHITLATSNEGTLNAVEAAVPAAAGWFPWFDQPEGQPMEIEGMGKVYTQHVYLGDPRGMVPDNAGLPVILDGRHINYSGDPKPHLHGETPFVPVRAAVELLGGKIEWNPDEFKATATLVPDGMSYEWLKQANPKLSSYEQLSPFVPNMGFHYGVKGPGLVFNVDNSGRVVGVELVSPAAAGWFPWFDQPEGQAAEIPGMGQVYTQHLFLVDPATIK